MEQEEQKFTDNSWDFGDREQSQQEKNQQQEVSTDVQKSGKKKKKKSKKVGDNVQSQQDQFKQQEDKNADVQRSRKKMKSQNASDNVQSQQDQINQQEDKNADVQRSRKKMKTQKVSLDNEEDQHVSMQTTENARLERTSEKDSVQSEEKQTKQQGDKKNVNRKSDKRNSQKDGDNVESQKGQIKQQEDIKDNDQSQKSGKPSQKDRYRLLVVKLENEKEILEAQLKAATTNKPEEKICDCITGSPSFREQVETLNAELENIRRESTQQMDILSREKKSAEQTQKDLVDEIDKLKKETNRLKNEISEWKNDVSLLSDKKAAYMQRVSEKEQEINNFQEAYKIEKAHFEKVIKEKDKKIQDLNAEKKYISSECTQKDKNMRQLENRLKALQQKNENLHNIRANQSETITTLGQEKEALQEDKKSLVLRLSKLAGASLTYQNPDIADLSDEKRPTKLAEEFSELYDNEWTDAFEQVDIEDEKDKTTFMLELLKRANELCNELAENHIQTIKKSFSTITVKSKVHPKHTPEGHLDDKLPVATQPKPGTSSKTEQEEAEDIRDEADTDVNTPKNDSKNVEDDGITTDLRNPDVTQVTHLEADTDVKHSENAAENEGDLEVSLNSIFFADTDEHFTLNDTKYMEADTDNITVLNDHTMTDKGDIGNGELHGPALVQNIEDQETLNTSEDSKSAMGQGYQFVDNPVKDSDLEIPSQLPPEEFGTPVNNLEMGTQNQFAAQQSHDRNEDEEPKQKKMKLESNYELLSKEQKKTILEARKFFEKELSVKIERAGTDFIVQELGIDVQKQGTVAAYIQKCINICWSMCRLEPPVHVEFATADDDIPFDTNTYKPYTKSGSHLDYLVWPAVYLHRGGPMLAKGVAQGKKK